MATDPTHGIAPRGHGARKDATSPRAAGGHEAVAKPRPGSARPCAAYRGELARHRVITADGLDYVVATAGAQGQRRGYVTAAYPVARGYLVMLRQPLCLLPSEDEASAQAQHAQLVDVLANLGTAVVRAKRRSAAWRQAERRVEPAHQPGTADTSRLTAAGRGA